LDGRTNVSECLFEALFNDLQPKSSDHSLEKCFEKAFGNVRPTVQNLCLGGANLPNHILEAERRRRRG